MKNEDRNYIMFLYDIQTAMSRISEYIDCYDFESFKRDYKTVDAVSSNLFWFTNTDMVNFRSHFASKFALC